MDGCELSLLMRVDTNSTYHLFKLLPKGLVQTSEAKRVIKEERDPLEGYKVIPLREDPRTR